MSTPMSPEPPHSDGSMEEDEEEEQPVEAALDEVGGERGTGSLEAFADGAVRSADVARLSDLDRDAVARFVAEWPLLPDTTRERIVRTMDELVVDRVDLIFGRVLRLALDDPSAVVRQLAVAALWEDERQDLIEPLREILAQDPSPDVRAEAARGLGRFARLAESGELPESVGRLLHDDLLSVASDDRQPALLRQRALESAAVFARDPAIRSLILDAYELDDQAWQGSALFAMGQTHDVSWLPTVIDELASPDALLRYEAARACGVLGDEEAVPELLTCGGDEDAEVRQAAIAALGQIGGRSAIRALQTLSTTADEADQETIEAALEEAFATADPFGSVA